MFTPTMFSNRRPLSLLGVLPRLGDEARVEEGACAGAGHILYCTISYHVIVYHIMLYHLTSYHIRPGFLSVALSHPQDEKAIYI